MRVDMGICMRVCTRMCTCLPRFTCNGLIHKALGVDEHSVPHGDRIQQRLPPLREGLVDLRVVLEP